MITGIIVVALSAIGLACSVVQIRRQEAQAPWREPAQQEHLRLKDAWDWRR